MTASKDEFDFPVYQLMIGEIISWSKGICEINAHRTDGEHCGIEKPPDYLTVVGENGHRIGRVDLSAPREPIEVDKELADLVKAEQDSL